MQDELQATCLLVLDTIVVPAHPKGFNEVFLIGRRWKNVKMDFKRRDEIRYIAAYQTKPISAITHYAEIARFEPLEKIGRYDVVFAGEPIEINAVRFTHADVCAVQGPRYTTLERILSANHLSCAFPS